MSIFSNELVLRLLTGMLLAALSTIFFIQGDWLFHLFCASVGGILTWEIVYLANPNSTRFQSLFLAIFASILAFMALMLSFSSLIDLSLILLTPIVGCLLLSKGRGKFLIFSILILFSVFILGKIRLDLGLLFALWLIMTVISTDIFAFLFGKLFGGIKIAPKLSPNKTLSGSIGGCLGATFVSYGFHFIEPQASLGVGLLIAISAQIGDLGESWLKRNANVKNSSFLLPGHGGFCDRFDSMVGGCLGYWIIHEIGRLFGSGVSPLL